VVRELHLEHLINGTIKGLSKSVSAFLYESVIVALYLNNHKSGIPLNIEGTYQETFLLNWTTIPTQKILKNWTDKKETVEYASTAIAFLLLDKLTDYVFFGRAAQDDVADYLLNKKGKSSNFEESNPFAYLEVSGIWKENKKNTLNMRFNLKKRNLEQQNPDKFPYVIVVAEFSIPKAKIEKNG